jgi:hypothetical protein
MIFFLIHRIIFFSSDVVHVYQRKSHYAINFFQAVTRNVNKPNLQYNLHLFWIFFMKNIKIEFFFLNQHLVSTGLLDR